MLECMEILSVAAQKRISVYSVKGAWRLDQSIQSKIIAMAFSMAAEIERDLISQRTKEALRFKKAHGMKLGRPTGPGKSKLDPYRPEIESLLANGSPSLHEGRLLAYKITRICLVPLVALFSPPMGDPARSLVSRELPWPGEADQVTLGVREVADHEICPWVPFGTHPARPAEALGFLERGLDVGNAHVEDRVGVVAHTSADAAWDPRPIAGRVAVHEPVVPRLGDRLRSRSGGVELPSEQVAVVAPELVRIFPDDLKVHNWLSHG
jgi:Resolvase, N terminal domain